ncbi:MAG TPA: Pycsar system effector family protein [Chitinophagaceae bacterium]|nr:Pycsar system effector family protein [Chitinophagaceae bacterium]
MNVPNTPLLAEAQIYVTDLLHSKINKSLTFHNIEHTQDVVAASKQLADHYQLSSDDRLVLMLAAWFHDTGYIYGKMEGHEEESAEIAKEFLSTRNVSPHIIDAVVAAIRATKIPQSPTTLVEQMLCDADLAHLGNECFKRKNSLLRSEMSFFSGEEISKKKWRKINIEFLEKHRYFTDYALAHLQPVQDQHLAEIKKKHEAAVPPQNPEEVLMSAAQELKSESDTRKKKEKEDRTERGISTVFRIMASNHANLSHMADNKAHIMISVNSIILSVVISLLIRHLDEHRNLVIPTMLLVGFCTGATIFAVLATRPKIIGGTFSVDDIHNKTTNLLFFGNFHKMKLEDYDWAMKQMLNDRNYLYESIIKDIYYLGVVLARKYKYLRISYNIFMVGLIVATLAFGITMVADSLWGHATTTAPAVTP